VIRDGYRQLCAQTGIDDVAVAVRSSATAEDQPDASFAGQQDTYLWIRGSDNVVNHVVRCWASLYTDRAIAYRHENGYPHADVAMSVAVQQMVLPKAAGVAFTLNPTNGDRSTIVIDSAFGLGESVVSGVVTPDNYMIDKVIFEITRRTVSVKEVECCVENGRVVQRPLDEDRSTSPSLTDNEIKAIARLARQAEKHFGRPQDVEWAVTIGEGGEPAVHLLQSRPETVWSNKPRQVSQGVHTGVEGVVSNLLKPIQVKQ
jgi:pyruvate,water dikinase